MSTYTLPREAFNLLEEAFGERHKAEVFALAIESAIDGIKEKANETIVEKKEHIKIEVKEELKKELVTREIFEERFNLIDERFKGLEREMDERFNVVDEKFKSLNFKLNIFIAIALMALTFANPAFVKLIEKIF
ncbi:MAG: hypothetical protein AB1797_09620 [bacterium]